MMMYCLDERESYEHYLPGHEAKLLFVCKTQGEESAIPRVMHKHDERMELMFIARGSGDYNIGDRSYLAQQGDILIFNAGTVHDERPHLSEDSLIYSCGIHNIQLKGLNANQLMDNSQAAVVSSGSESAQIENLFEILAQQCAGKDLHYGAVTHHLLGALVVMIKRLCDNHQLQMSAPEFSLGQRMKKFIDEHYMEDINLDSITTELNMNRFYLSHTFKNYAGYSPKQYLIRRRIGEAQTLLLSSHHSVADIATMVGYDNVKNFYRMFKHVVGMAPNQYKLLWSGGAELPGN